MEPLFKFSMLTVALTVIFTIGLVGMVYKLVEHFCSKLRNRCTLKEENEDGLL